MTTQDVVSPIPKQIGFAVGGKTKQLNVDVEEGLLKQFTLMCERDRVTKREITEMLISAWLTAGEGRGSRHLDGSECPLSKLISGLEEVLLARMR